LFCKQLTVGRTQMPPGVSTGDPDTVVRQVTAVDRCGTGARPFRHRRTVIASLKKIQHACRRCGRTDRQAHRNMHCYRWMRSSVANSTCPMVVKELMTSTARANERLQHDIVSQHVLIRTNQPCCPPSLPFPYPPHRRGGWLRGCHSEGCADVLPQYLVIICGW